MTHTDDITIQTYNKIASKYPDTYYGDSTELEYIDTFLSYLPNKPYILDVGCGTGRFTTYFLTKECYVDGIDLANNMIEIAKERIPLAEFKHMDMRKMDYEDSTFDGVFLGYSLIHIKTEDLQSTLIEQRRVLKDNGYIMIIAQQGPSDQIIKVPEYDNEEMFVNYFSINDLKTYLEKANFKIIYQEVRLYKSPDSYTEGVNYIIGKKAV